MQITTLYAEAELCAGRLQVCLAWVEILHVDAQFNLVIQAVPFTKWFAISLQ